MTISVTPAHLRAIAGPKARKDLIDAIVRGWPDAIAYARITTKRRAAHFIAQIMTETGSLTVLSESGAYKFERILAIFGQGHHSAAVTPAEAKRIAALPIAQRERVLFNRVYGVGNPTKAKEFGNAGPDDGWLFRGGGMMQATGKSNYAVLEKKTGLPLVAHPELLHQPDSAFKTAYLEWAQDGRCNAAADRNDVVAVRKIINGGKNGLDECRAFLAKAMKVLPDDAAAVAVPAAPAAAEKAPIAADDEPTPGDISLAGVQQRLKAMNYNPGRAASPWGGMTRGALSGFLNDRKSLIFPPTSDETFDADAVSIGIELTKAEAEDFKRPVTEQRASGNIEVVAESAPEIKPVRRNFLAALWATIVAIVSAIVDAVSGYVVQAWRFFTDNRDALPADPATIWSYASAVPIAIWFVAGAGFLAFMAWNSRVAMRQISGAVQTGARP